ncbi:hypothetical protein EAF00_010602 [Botryotinia globosa]|nr:hypothetical protein EAF00_010602 [Botryotinia globosa]
MKCGNAENIKETQKERKAKAPRKLPRNRPRSLTSPLGADSNKSNWPSWNLFERTIKQKSFDQSQSSLLGRLPSEIRRLIWLETLGGHFLHIARDNKRIMAIGCVEPDPEIRERWRGCWGGLQELTIRLLGGLGDWTEPYEELTAPLLDGNQGSEKIRSLIVLF